MYGLKMQDAVTSTMMDFFGFHDMSLMVILFVSLFVGVGMVLLGFWGGGFALDVSEKEGLEIMWTMLPAVVLVFLAYPSMLLLYFSEFPSEKIKVSEVVKVTGHQWYWSYNFFFGKEEFEYDSFMVGEGELSFGDFRNLEVDKPLFLEWKKFYRLVATSQDVIHSFALPSFGLKIDCIPGRLNQLNFVPLFVGSFYGQCSEICGVNHSFMPINVEVMKSC